MATNGHPVAAGTLVSKPEEAIAHALKKHADGEWSAEHTASVLDIWTDEGDPILVAWQKVREEADEAFIHAMKQRFGA